MLVCVSQLRKAAQSGVVSLLREGTATGGFHPSTTPTAKHCKHVIDKGGEENGQVQSAMLCYKPHKFVKAPKL